MKRTKLYSKQVLEKIPFESKISHIKDITERNAAFEKLTPRQKSKEIAYDGIKVALMDSIKASTYPTYWTTDFTTAARLAKDPLDLQDKLLHLEKMPECRLCERGLWMVAQIRCSNTLWPDDEYLANGNVNNIKGVDLWELKDMEAEYENSAFDHPYSHNTRGKLINVMCNVINNGKFKTEDNTDYIKKWKMPVKIDGFGADLQK